MIENVAISLAILGLIVLNVLGAWMVYSLILSGYWPILVAFSVCSLTGIAIGMLTK